MPARAGGWNADGRVTDWCTCSVTMRSQTIERNSMSVSRQSPATQTAAVQVVALVVGVVFLLLGVLGFIPGVVTNFDEFGATGPDSGALLFGLFLVSIQKNIAHLLFGIVGVLCARGARSARNYLIWGACSTWRSGSSACSSRGWAARLSTR